MEHGKWFPTVGKIKKSGKSRYLIFIIRIIVLFLIEYYYYYIIIWIIRQGQPYTHEIKYIYIYYIYYLNCHYGFVYLGREVFVSCLSIPITLPLTSSTLPGRLTIECPHFLNLFLTSVERTRVLLRNSIPHVTQDESEEVLFACNTMTQDVSFHGCTHVSKLLYYWVLIKL